MSSLHINTHELALRIKDNIEHVTPKQIYLRSIIPAVILLIGCYAPLWIKWL